jgi:hypothetical protein
MRKTVQNAQSPKHRATGMQMMAFAACVGTIALAGLAFLFLPGPVGKTARMPPPETVSVADEHSVTTEGRTMRAQGPAILISHDDEPAHAKPSAPPQVRTAPSASLPDPAAPPTASQANNAPVRANDTRREMVAVERSGVNIRSAPSPSSRLVGSVPKGARFEVTNRSGHWIEIESDGVKGWISGHFVGPAERR